MRRQQNGRSGRRAPVIAEAVERRLMFAFGTTATLTPTGTGAQDAVIADFNADGKQDVAAVTLSGGVSVFSGNGNGTFGGRTDIDLSTTLVSLTFVHAADLNGDALPDLVVGSSRDDVSVLINLGGLTFGPATTYATAGASYDARSADFDGDGDLDLAVASGSVAFVSVLLNGGDGTFAPRVDYATNALAWSLDVADFDADGFADLVVGARGGNLSFHFGAGDGTFPVRRNEQIGGSPLVTIAGDFQFDGGTDVEVMTVNSGTRRGSIGTTTNEGPRNMRRPKMAEQIGFPIDAVATDYDGDTDLDVLILNRNGDITVATNKNLGSGRYFDHLESLGETEPFPTHMAGGDLNGDGKIDLVVAAGNSIRALVNGASSGGGGNNTPGDTDRDGVAGEPAALTPSVTKTTLPSVFVPGDKGTATIGIANTGDATASGRVTVELFASTDGTLDDGDTLLDTAATLTNKAVRASGGRTALLTGKFVAPSSLANGTYTILAKVTPLDIEGLTGPATAASTTTMEKVTRFGEVGDRRNVKYTVTDADGTLVTYAMSGPGVGIVSDDGSSITIDDTTDRSTFTATTKSVRTTPGSDAATSIAHLTVNGPIAGISGKGLSITSSLWARDDVKTILLDDLYNASGDVSVRLEGLNTPVSISADRVLNAVMTVTGGIASLKVSDWSAAGFSDDRLGAQWIGKLTVTGGGLAADLVLNGFLAPRGTALGTAKIAQGLNSRSWAIEGNVGAVTVGDGVPAGWVGDVTGNLKSLTVKGNFAGSLAAANINTFAVTGDVSNATVRAGWGFGPDNLVGTGDDTAAVGVLTRLAIKGAVTASAFWAGVDINGDPVAGGAIKAIGPIAGVDATTTFVAASLPRTVRFAGATVATANDPRFVST